MYNENMIYDDNMRKINGIDISNNFTVNAYIFCDKIKLNDYSTDTLDKVIFELTNQIILLKTELSNLKLKLDEVYYRRGVSY